MTETNSFSTNRVKLVEINENSTDTIVEMRSNPKVYQYFKNPHKITRNEHIKWYESIYLNTSTYISWISYFEDVPMGLFQIKRIDDDSAEISYLLKPEYQGKGFASEVVCEIEKWSHLKWGVSYVVAEVREDNRESLHFIKKMGYTLDKKDGQFEQYRKYIG